MWLLRHSPCLSACGDIDSACVTRIAPVTIFGYQITVNNWVLIYVYYTGGVIYSFFLSYSDLFLHTLARCSGYCYTWLHSMTNIHTHTHTHTHSVGFLWTSDQPIAVILTWRHTTLTRDGHPWPRRHSNPQSQQASHALDRAAPVVSILYISLEFKCILFQLTHEANLKKKCTQHILFGKHFYTTKERIRNHSSITFSWFPLSCLQRGINVIRRSLC